MASAAANRIKELLWEKVIDGNNDTFKITLQKEGFTFSRSTHEKYADISGNELTGEYGYTAGGKSLSGVSITKDDTEHAGIISWSNVSWTIIGGDITTVGAIIYDDTVSSPVDKPILGYIDFGGSITTFDGGTFTIANIGVPIF